MGPLRGGLTGLLTLIPAATSAGQVCATARPDWDGVAVGAAAEALTLFASPMGLVLLVLTAVVIRYRSSWGGVAITVGWTVFASLVTMLDPTGQRAFAVAEGCMGPPTLFIAIAAAISVGTIFYTAPRTAAKP
ncbi:MAG: hypothetical protein AAF744_15775 [Pseudomonadota bacterium]